jgi:hypothetical protein
LDKEVGLAIVVVFLQRQLVAARRSKDQEYKRRTWHLNLGL